MGGRSVGFLVYVVFLLLFIVLEVSNRFSWEKLFTVNQTCIWFTASGADRFFLLTFYSVYFADNIYYLLSLVGNFAASVCSTHTLETVYFDLSPKSTGRFSSPACNEVTHLPLSTSLSPSSWCWPSVHSTTSMARRKTLRGWACCVDRTTMHGDTKRPRGEGERIQIAAVFSLRLDQVEWQVLPLDITLLLLHPEDDGGSLTGSLFFVCLVLCHLELQHTAHAYFPLPHRWTRHMKPGGLMQRVSGALWILRRQQEG